jgi:dienelactone hydrolase
MKLALVLLILLAVALAQSARPTAAAEPQPLPGTEPLTREGDLAAQMVQGIDRFLMRETAESVKRREAHWHRDFSSPEAYSRSVEPNREHLRKIIGVVDPRVSPVEMQRVAGLDDPAEVAKTDRYRVLAVRWSVLDGMDAEGLLLEPTKPAKASVIALPDCDWTPEMLVGLAPGVQNWSQFARRLAESGCRVIVPTLIDRSDTYSGNPKFRMTNQPHREWVYRGAFEMGRHVIGYEVQKVLAAVDWLKQRDANGKIGVFGYGEGGLLALYSAAVDTRVDATVVSGYFGPRENLWQEPIYRNVWGLLEEFGDAEIATLITPRSLTLEQSDLPGIDGPPTPGNGRSGAAPGAIHSVSAEEWADEGQRIVKLCPSAHTIGTGSSKRDVGNPASLKQLLKNLGVTDGLADPTRPPQPLVTVDASARQKRQLDQMDAFNQKLLREGARTRDAFWSKADRSSAEKFQESARHYRDLLWDEVIGRFPPASVPMAPKSRLVYDEPKFRGYEVTLEVWPEVYAYGILCLPKDIKPGERRPVVVCQHGLEGRPQDVADPKVDSPYYHRFAARLADQGFITFAPQNPYIGQDLFRVLQRKANPLKKSLFSVIVRQHERILEWLGPQPWVDKDRIAFYGLSYGGKTAMRVPALLEGYCLSICSGDFNEWVWKNVSVHDPYSYMFTGEYEMFEFDLGNTFNYAEMSWLIFPRPFMVERGHDDGVAPDDYVSFEWAKSFQRWDRFGMGDRAKIEFFNGPHTIHGVGTFEFLHKQLHWPPPG